MKRKEIMDDNKIFLGELKTTKQNEKKRNYGIDLYKILATINIIILHINKHSGLIELNSSSLKYKKIWSLEIFCYWGVDGFGLISGFIGYKKYKYSNLLYLWMEVFFYSILISFFLLLTNEITKKEMIYSFFPILIKRHWYVNAYFCMYFFLPFINEGIKNLKKNLFRNTVIFFIIFYSFYNVIARLINKTDYNYLNSGYSISWLTILYIIGAYFAKYVINTEKNVMIIYYIFNLSIYFILSIFTLGIHLKSITFSSYFPNNIFIDYLSPTILFQAISLLMFFSKLQINNILLKHIISFINPLNFSAILIHGRLFPTKNILTKLFFTLINNYNRNYLFFSIYLNGIIIYILCILIDYLRLSLFKILKVRELCQFIETIFSLY